MYMYRCTHMMIYTNLDVYVYSTVYPHLDEFPGTPLKLNGIWKTFILTFCVHDLFKSVILSFLSFLLLLLLQKLLVEIFNGRAQQSLIKAINQKSKRLRLLLE